DLSTGLREIVFDAYGTLFFLKTIAAECTKLYPGQGGEVAGAWRKKQLEYTWLLSLMKKYSDFESVTKRALSFTLKDFGFAFDEPTLERLFVSSYFGLKPFQE